MKTHKLFLKLLFILSFLYASAFAQKEITVTEVTKQMSRGEQPGFFVKIPGAKLKDVMAAYKKQLELNTKANAKEIDGELVNYGVVNKNFSDRQFIIYSKFLETMEGVEMTVFATEDSLAFINESGAPEKVAALKKSIRDFAVSEYRKVVSKKLEMETGKLNDLKKSLEKSHAQESDNLNNISKNQREIENYKSKIEQNKSAQKEKSDQISRQQTTLSEISDKSGTTYKSAENTLKNFKKDLSDLEKEQSKAGAHIDDSNTQIRESERKNEELKKQQEDQKTKVEAQEKVVKDLENELAGIK
jgi:DNA repair exonuclease SbcCD ATPase subunit